MSQLPRISVVIPIYNAEATLQRALDSVRAQTCPPFEVVCVDDGSSDGSLTLAEHYDAEGAFVLKVVQQPYNAGVAAARNRGMEEAKGEFVAFLDADDTWAPDKLTRQSEAIVRENIDLLGGYSGLLTECIQVSCTCTTADPIDTHTVTLLSSMLSNPFHTSTVMLRRDAQVRFRDNGCLSEDYALWLQLIAAGWRCARHTEVLAFMHKPAFGASGLSAQQWRMQRGELAALIAVSWRAHRGALALALPVSCLKFCIRLLRTWLR